MSWQDRTGSVILLTSPSGATFEAGWAGDARKADKKLGIFEYPKARGAVVQDLKSGPTKIPHTIYFDGPDHDVTADQFYIACGETGVWRVEHPVHGPLTLQLVSYEQEVQPVTSGNVTAFSLEWIEPGIDLAALPSVAELAVSITYQCDAVRDAAYTQLPGAVRGSTLADLKRLAARAVDVFNNTRDSVTAVNATISRVRQSVLGTVQGAVSTITGFAGAVQELIDAPARILSDASVRFDYYKDTLSAATSGLFPTSRVALGVRESIVASSIAGMSQSLAEIAPRSREAAMKYLTDYNEAFAAATAALDAGQALYVDQSLDQQYFSQSEAYNDILQLVRMTGNMLLRKSFDLAASRYITLQSNRCPVEIALTENVDLDDLIEWNALHGTEILLLPVGRQVVVYQ